MMMLVLMCCGCLLERKQVTVTTSRQNNHTPKAFENSVCMGLILSLYGPNMLCLWVRAHRKTITYIKAPYLFQSHII